MNLADWLQYLSTLHPATIELGCERIAAVAARLSCQHTEATVITVAGTNGKGSTIRCLEALLLAAGYRLGVYTSPHLLHFSERLRLQAQPVAEQQWCAAFAAVEEARQQIRLTYFEFTTVAALFILKQHPLDFWLLEVGMGGRLDAVNSVDADLAVFTSLGLDHCQYLGNTLDEIAREKAGILRAHRPLVLGLSAAEVPPSLQRIMTDLQVPCCQLGKEFTYRQQQHTWQCQVAEQVFTGSQLLLPLHSVACALAATQQLQQHYAVRQLPAAAAVACLSQTALPGRFQRLSYQGREVILDVAHNGPALQLLQQRLQQLPAVKKNVAVLAMLEDKCLPGIFQPLQACFAAWFLAELADEPRGLSTLALQQELGKTFACPNNSQESNQLSAVRIEAFTAVQAAFSAALAATAMGDRIVVFGSFYTVAAVLTTLTSEAA